MSLRPDLEKSAKDRALARRRTPLETQNGTKIPFPFGQREMKDMVVPYERFTQARFWRDKVLSLDPSGLHLPHRLIPPFNRGGMQIIYDGPNQKVIKVSIRSFYAERMVVLQGVLSAYGVPYLNLATDETALTLAELWGMTFQERIPEGSTGLTGIAQGAEKLSEVLINSENRLGRAARTSLEDLYERLRRISEDAPLQTEGFIRGYSVLQSRASQERLRESELTDFPFEKTDGFWPDSAYFRADRGWFLMDW